MAPPAALHFPGVYLLYADESGDLSQAAVGNFVVGGIAVHEDAIRPLAGQINNTINQFIGQRLGKTVEVHGGPMRSGRGEWAAVPGAKRHALAHALLRLICDWTHEPTGSKVEPIAVVMDRDHSQSPTETTYGELLYVFDEFLRAGRRRGDPHNGVLVADRSRYEKTLEAWVEVARLRRARPQDDPRRLHALAEAPFFVDSKITRLMQLADLVAHALYRAYNADDWSWATTVMPSLITPDPRRIVHFTGDANCRCPACGGAVETAA